MSSLDSIPTEIIREIAEFVLDPELQLPAIGGYAAWRVPPYAHFPWTEAGITDTMYPEHLKEETERREMFLERGQQHCSLKALRSVNRFFNEICEPLLYREQNLVAEWQSGTFLEVKRTVIDTKWTHIQNLSVFADIRFRYTHLDQRTHLELVGDTIAECKNLRSLSIYYRYQSTEVGSLVHPVFKLIQDGFLVNIGIYAQAIVKGDFYKAQNASTVQFIEDLCLSELARTRLRSLDIAVESIAERTFDLIRQHLTSLKSLTIRRTLETPWINFWLWNQAQQSKWFLNPNLTRLQLAHNDASHPGHIPHLLRFFPALKELTISACGNDQHWVKQVRVPGWSKHRDSLARTHATLDWFHIEHMDAWELYELGMIPTKELIITTVKKSELLTAFQDDAELFPGMKLLRVGLGTPENAPCVDDGDGDDEDETKEKNETHGTANGKPTLVEICRVRGIEIRRDAEARFTCTCDRSGAEHY